MKHTPGPWRVEIRNEKKWKADVLYNAKNGFDAFICLGVNVDDARLIAAAPEMLEWLIRYKKDYKGYCLPELDLMIEKATGKKIEEVVK
ncbi:MAG: hypothetical protein GY865_11725 [candidate division Zixibacteria bacterium]|nr:hypothetical protein [candidate division Zixibacteria bacterium]